MERVERESYWFGCPCFADGFVGGETLEGLQSAAEVVGVDEVVEVPAELVVGVVVEALDGGFLDRPVHAFDLTVGPGMARLGQPVIDVVLGAGIFECVGEELLAVIHGATDLGGCRAGVSG